MGHMQCPLTKLSRKKQVWTLGQMGGMAFASRNIQEQDKIYGLSLPGLCFMG